jgi:hypothetical protein
MRVKVLKRQPKSFAGTARYLAGLSRGMSPERVAWMEARNLETTDPDLAAEIMEATAAKSTRCKTPAYHAIIAFDPKDAEAGRVTPEIMKKVAAVTIERLGLAEHQMLIYAHNDEPHPHMHFLVNRVHPETGKAWSRSHDYERFLSIARDQARVYGLNVARERTREMELEPEWMTAEAKTIVDDLGSIPDGEAWKAKREQRAPERLFTREAIERLRPALQKDFARAQSWDALADALRGHGLSLRAKGQGLILSDGTSYLKLSEVGKAVRLPDLERRFGQTFLDHSESKAQAAEREHKAKAPRPPEMPDTSKMSPAQKWQTEVVHANRLDVYERQRNRDGFTDDPIADLDAVDEEFRTWTGKEATHRYAKKRVTDLERQEQRLIGRGDRERLWRKMHEDRFMAAMRLIFKDGKAAAERWDQIERERGRAEALRLMRRDPAAFGDIKGWKLAALKSPERRVAEAAWRRVGEMRLKHQNSLMRLEANWNQVRENRALLESARARYASLTFNPEAIEPLPVILRRIIGRRLRALERVTFDMIKQSDLAAHRKEELYMALRKHRERELDLRRAHTMQQEGVIYREVYAKQDYDTALRKDLHRKLKKKSKKLGPEPEDLVKKNEQDRDRQKAEFERKLKDRARNRSKSRSPDMDIDDD